MPHDDSMRLKRRGLLAGVGGLVVAGAAPVPAPPKRPSIPEDGQQLPLRHDWRDRTEKQTCRIFDNLLFYKSLCQALG